MEKLQVITGENKKDRAPANELGDLAKKYSRGLDAEIDYVVYGRDQEGSYGVVHWIRSCSESGFAARRISRLINLLGGETKVISMEEYEKNENDYSKDVVDYLEGI